MSRFETEPDKPKVVDPAIMSARETIGQVRQLTHVLGQIVPAMSPAKPVDITALVIAVGNLVVAVENAEKAQEKRHKEVMKLLEKKTTITIKSTRANAPTYTAEIE